MPESLRQRLPTDGRNLKTAELRVLIQDLCAWQALRSDELALYLGRDKKYLRTKHLAPMVQAGDLVFLYPESPNHKWQAYVAGNSTTKLCPPSNPGAA